MISYKITSQQGNITADNRDATLALKVDDVNFFIIMDGSSSKKYSGKFASLMLQDLQQRLPKLKKEQLATLKIKESLELMVEQSRKNIMYQCVPASMSIFILAVIKEKLGLALWAGDCALAKIQRNDKLRWLTVPHTLLNQPIPKIKSNPQRHLLVHTVQSCLPITLPGVCVFYFEKNIKLLLATDGWWSVDLPDHGWMRDDQTIIELSHCPAC